MVRSARRGEFPQWRVFRYIPDASDIDESELGVFLGKKLITIIRVVCVRVRQIVLVLVIIIHVHRAVVCSPIARLAVRHARSCDFEVRCQGMSHK
jgi:hypothetical protein